MQLYKKKMLVFGGSFNPPHYGHLKIVKKAFEIIKPDNVMIIPNFSNPLKNDAYIDPYDKFKMTKLMFENELPNLKICEFELKNNNYSFFYLTLKHLIELYPNYEMHFVIGYDQYSQLELWNEYEWILDNITSCLVFNRFNGENLELKINPFLEKWKSKIEFVDFTFSGSSTIIRLEEINENYTKPEIINYINDKGLYGIERIRKYCTKKRFAHSIRVANYAYYIATLHELDNPMICYVAGLYHDIAKDFADELLINMAKKISYIPKNLPPELLHPHVGAQFIKDKYKIDNTIILKAIAKHTKPFDYFNEEPNIYEKIIYIADKIEPLRSDNNFCLRELKYYRALCETDIDKCFKEVYEDVQTLIEMKKKTKEEQE